MTLLLPDSYITSFFLLGGMAGIGEYSSKNHFTPKSSILAVACGRLHGTELYFQVPKREDTFRSSARFFGYAVIQEEILHSVFIEDGRRIDRNA